MAKTQRLIHLGNPEHTVDVDTAREAFAHKLTYEPNPNIRKDFDSAIDSYRVHSDLMRSSADILALRYDVPEGIEGINHVPGYVADKAIQRLQGPNKEFDKFTVEALSVISEPMLEELVANPDPSIDEAISALPKSNGKTFTSVQTLRVMDAVLSGDELDGSKFLAANRSTVAKKSIEGVDEIAVRGRDVFKQTLVDVEASGKPNERYDELNAFEQLTDDQQEAVTRMYKEHPERLDEILQVYKDDVEPGAHLTDEGVAVSKDYDIEEHDQYVVEAEDGELTLDLGQFDDLEETKDDGQQI